MVPLDDELRSGKRRTSSPPTSSSDEDNGNHHHQPHIRNFYSDASYNPNNVNDLLARELMQLSVIDRNRISEEIHGVRCMAPEETPELIENSLKQLESELSAMPSSKKKAYLMAVTASIAATAEREQSKSQTKSQTKSPGRSPRCSCDPPGYCYVQSREFRLKFLRCEFFDAKKAAQRMVHYLDLLAFRFPFENNESRTDVLRRPLIMADFTEKEQSILRKGVVQLLPFRDRSGRRVLTGVASLGIRMDPFVFYKILLYLMVVAGDDVETQQKGLVVVLWPNPDIADTIQLRFPINKGGELAKAVLEAAPVRVVAYHMCTPENVPFFQVVRSVFALILGNGSKRSRLKFHEGEPVELRYQISGYGIPVDLLPLTPTGNVKTSYLKHWIRLRCTLENALMWNFYTCGMFGVCPGENHKNNKNNSNCDSKQQQENDSENEETDDEDNDNDNDNDRCVDSASTKSEPGTTNIIVASITNSNIHMKLEPVLSNKPSRQQPQSQLQTITTTSPAPPRGGNGNPTSEYGIYTMIECPGSLDVVFRPGRPVMNHPGNVAFRSLIESKSDEHERARQTEKSIIAKSVVDEMIVARGGRFLVWNEFQGCWTAIRDGNRQRHKVAIAFRNFKSYKKALGNRQTQAESAMAYAFEGLGHGDVRRSRKSEAGDEKKRKRKTAPKNNGTFCFM